jgi:transposase
MSVEIDVGDLARRLVISRKRDGLSVYDPVAKNELIEACVRPGVSVTKVARECGVNANQLSTWIRERQKNKGAAAAIGEVVEVCSAAFVPVEVQGAPARPQQPAAEVDLQARLPNGVVVDLRGCDLQQASSLLEMLGRLRCSASTKG